MWGNKFPDMNKNIQLKEELQQKAEQAHIQMGYKSTICASVGSGKSKIAVNRINSYKFKSNKPIHAILFAGAREIYLEMFKKELIKFELEHMISEITFCCVASLKKQIKVDWDLIIIDESHLDVERILEFLQVYKNKPCEILLLTGTPISEKNEIGREIYKICPISFRKGLDDSIDESLINDYRISIVYHSLNNEDKYIRYGAQAFQTEQQKYGWLYRCYQNSFNRTRKKFPFELNQLKLFFKNLKTKEEIALKLLRKIDGKVLVYAGSIEQSERMGMPVYHSKLKKEERVHILNSFITGDILSLCNIAGIRESANIPKLKFGIIMAPDASENNFEQTVGRFSRLVIGEVAHITVLCAKNTIEEVWLNNAMKRLDSTKINKVNIEQIENLYQ